MQQPRRDAYLQALGITIYKLRQPTYVSAPLATSTATAAISNEVTKTRFDEVAIDVRVAQLQPLRQEVAQCTKCNLSKTRSQTVFGSGCVSAACMLVGEGPGAEEDRQGEPFVGRAGQLLQRMLVAIGLSRLDVYIANIVKCRPPGNRNPQAQEIAACQAYLNRQIALVNPRVIVALGRIAAQHLTQTTASIKTLRLQQYRFADSNIPLLVTYHPAYLLRNAIDKRKAWDDLNHLRKLLEVP